MLLIDGNNIAYANHCAMTLTCGSFQTQAIFGMFKSMQKLMTMQYPGWAPMVLWDGHPEWRYQLFPEYKGNRKINDDPERAARRAAYKAQCPFIEKGLSLLGVAQMRGLKQEADDLAGVMTRKLANAGRSVVMVSGDQDWLCLLRDNVLWFDPVRDDKVTLANFTNYTGFFSVEEFVQGLAITGDDSDNIDGIDGVGDSTAIKFLAEHVSVEEFWRKVDSGAYKPKVRKSKTAKSKHPEELIASHAGRELIGRNLKLVDLRNVPTPSPEDMKIDRGSYDEEGFRTLCERLGFNSILREWDQFLGPFRANANKSGVTK